MVEINLMRIFGECFKDDDAASVMVRVLSREPQATRDRLLIELSQVTGIRIKNWQDRILALGSKKK
jgi:hypothetical protein